MLDPSHVLNPLEEEQNQVDMRSYVILKTAEEQLSFLNVFVAFDNSRKDISLRNSW